MESIEPHVKSSYDNYKQQHEANLKKLGVKLHKENNNSLIIINNQGFVIYIRILLYLKKHY